MIFFSLFFSIIVICSNFPSFFFKKKATNNNNKLAVHKLIYSHFLPQITFKTIKEKDIYRKNYFFYTNKQEINHKKIDKVSTCFCNSIFIACSMTMRTYNIFVYCYYFFKSFVKIL